MSLTVAVGCDVGGTKIALGRLDATGSLRDRIQLATPRQDPAAIASRIACYARRVAPPGTPVGVAAAGLVRVDGSVAAGSCIHWGGVPLAQQLRAQLDAPVCVINDGDAAAWGEHVRRGPGPRPLLMVSVGTGIGGGLVLDHGPYRGAAAMALEIGHLIVDRSGPACACGNRGCLQALAGGTAVGQAYSAQRGLPGEIDAQAVVQAAEAGDRLAARVLEEAGLWLGVGLASVVTILDPAVVVIGGSVACAGERLLAPARRALRIHVFARAHRNIVIEPSQCGSDAALLGAAAAAVTSLPTAADHPHESSLRWTGADIPTTPGEDDPRPHRSSLEAGDSRGAADPRDLR